MHYLHQSRRMLAYFITFSLPPSVYSCVVRAYRPKNGTAAIKRPTATIPTAPVSRGAAAVAMLGVVPDAIVVLTVDITMEPVPATEDAGPVVVTITAGAVLVTVVIAI